ncbi:MAG: hypothetical protein SOY98_09110 [Candidatus Cryptobacteroides sp.]|nr:hypothetical protein [Candidatus Cryptobacteroides sp.]
MATKAKECHDAKKQLFRPIYGIPSPEKWDAERKKPFYSFWFDGRGQIRIWFSENRLWDDTKKRVSMQQNEPVLKFFHPLSIESITHVIAGTSVENGMARYPMTDCRLLRTATRTHRSFSLCVPMDKPSVPSRFTRFGAQGRWCGA